MSYILDALRKSEKERKKKEIPDLLSVPEMDISIKKKRNVWTYGIIFSFLVIIVFIGYRYVLDLGKNKAGSLQSIIKNDSVSKFVKNEIHEEKVDKDIQKVGLSKSNINNVIENSGVTKKKDLDKKLDKSNTIGEYKSQNGDKPYPGTRLEAAVDETKKEDKNVEAEESEIKPEKDRIYSFNELPIQIVKKLPQLRISILLYSDEPSSRMVRINGYTLREGQTLLNDIVVEKILNDGVILNYHDFKFKIFNK